MWRRRNISRAPWRVVGWPGLEAHRGRAPDRSLGRQSDTLDEIAQPGPLGADGDLHRVADVRAGGKGDADVNRRLLAAALAHRLRGGLELHVSLERLRGCHA